MKRIPNRELDRPISDLLPFTNYNATIRGEIDPSGVYRITHWATTILEYDTNTARILKLRTDYISQTTSTLLGRILRALPSRAVEEYLPFVGSKSDLTRVRRMLGIR